MNMNRIILFLLSLAVFFISPSGALAEKQQRGDSGGSKNAETVKATAAGCLPATNFKYLNINNVNARINTGGDMWWDFENGKYEIPKGSGKTAMFSGSLWLGGIDVNDQLKLAAQMYRYGPDIQGRSDVDYWTGPLTVDGAASIDPETCRAYDQMFPMTREMVDNYVAAYEAGGEAWQEYVAKMPDEIKNWPAHGDISKGQSYYLAPFYDADGDGNYNPMNGDYPYYDLSGDLCGTKTPTADEMAGDVIEGTSVLSDQVIKGDQTLWWVTNDKGNTHSETTGTPIGVEIRSQAFAFSTNDELNNMSFYSYEIINRSTFTLADTYFSQWVDPDLGYSYDDYTGCDVERGLGFVYNGSEVDGNGQPWAYGSNPPAIGVDFFQGPYIDADGEDNEPFTGDCNIFDFNAPAGSANDGSAINGINFGDGIVDNERFGMRRFVYHNNASGATGGPYQNDPRFAIEYYNYLRGIWRDNSKMIYGGNGHESAGGYGPEADFMFPGTSDPCNWGTGGQEPNGPKEWDEETAGNQEGDRRFMQSAGPFTLQPGAVNYITVGIPWARAQSGGPLASVEKLKVADDKAQALFDNCFQVVNGPNAPDLTMQELDQKLLIYITNRDVNNTGNNYQERYEEIDPAITSPDTLTGEDRYDSTYVFEGYKVYQIKSPDVSPADFDDPDRAQLVFQCDIKNGIDQIINYEYNAELDTDVPMMKVDGSDDGIKHTFTITEDAFSNTPLVNHKQYYYKAIAYGYNNYLTYNPDPESQTPDANFYGQKLPYLEGRNNIKSYTGIPHKNVSDDRLASDYGDGIEVTRLQGVGNSGNYLRLKEEMYDELLAKSPYDTSMNIEDDAYPIIKEITYEAGGAPISVKVIDPLNVKNGSYAVILDSLRTYRISDVTGEPNVEAGGDTTSIQVASWFLKDMNTDDVFKSDTTIIRNNEQVFLDLGISVELEQMYRAGPKIVGRVEVGEVGGNPQFDPLAAIMDENNGYIGANIVYGDSSLRWLSGVTDDDSSPTGLTDWIRSGTNQTQDVGPDQPDLSDVDLSPDGQGYISDPQSVYESVLNGTWAPYKMTATSKQIATGVSYHGKTSGVNHNRNYYSRKMANWEALSSVDVVITPDSTKWTRCPVLEMSSDPTLAEGGAEPFSPRKSPSVNIHGEAGVESSDPLLNSYYIDSVGMSWFPGYAVNIETGERLNMAFGEDSWLVQDNGRDMLWNPTSRTYNSTFEAVLGGKHYVYVFAHDTIAPEIVFNVSTTMPPYDAGKKLKSMLDSTRFSIPIPPQITTPIEFIMATAMWATIPLANPDHPWLSTEVKVELRVNKPYDSFYTGLSDYSDYEVPGVDLTQGYPLYKFVTEGVAPVPKEDNEVEQDLDLISVVPNPYYGYSTYEQDQLDNRVKFVNLPRTCTISIYNVSGTLVRQYKKDDLSTQLDWDLTNFAGIPVSGGIYYIHVDAPGKGEQVIKWFGALRPIDLNAF
jgi:hypothetical protein